MICHFLNTQFESEPLKMAFICFWMLEITDERFQISKKKKLCVKVLLFFSIL